ncbi:MAG: PAS domain S-box protein [Nostoc sp.]
MQVVLARDITDYKQAQEALQLRAIFERSSIGIGIIDMKAQIIDTNLALCKIFGYSQNYTANPLQITFPQKGGI